MPLVRRWMGLLPCFALLVGCQGNVLPPETDPQAGREALRTVLAAWARGESLADFKQKQPIIAYDPDWENGRKLLAYELDAEDRRIGVDLLVGAKLTLADSEGKSRERTVNFSIAIGSQTVVLRQQ